MDYFLRNLKFLMKVNGHSAIDLAEELKVAHSTTFRYLNETSSISKGKREKLAKFYKIPIEKFNAADLQNEKEEKNDIILLNELSDMKIFNKALQQENEALRTQLEIFKRMFYDKENKT